MARRPNILLILNDQHRWDTLGCFGAPICRTPHLDALASRGVRFDAAYTPTSPCSPARAALFSGLYPHKNGVPVNDCTLNAEIPTLASELGAAGYQLGYAGKWHVDNETIPSDHGFAGHDIPGYGYPPANGGIEGLRFMTKAKVPPVYPEYLASKGLPKPRITESLFGNNPGQPGHEVYALHTGDIESSYETMAAEKAIELMREFSAASADAPDEEDHPFFVWTNFWGPHTPCLIPEPYYSMYDPSDVPYEPSFGETWANKPGVQVLFERFWGLREAGWDTWAEIIAKYWGYVTMIDDLIGRMVASLDEMGQLDNTLIVFGTDHGDQMGAHRLIEKGPFAYEETWRLPMLAAHPACENPGHVCDEFVYLHDLMPTFLDVAGCEFPEREDSRSILPQMLGREDPTDRDDVFCSFTAQVLPMEMRMVRTRTHKLVYNRSDIGELYDLVNDPHEMTNLIDQPESAAVQQDLIERMRAHMVRLEDPILGAFDRIRHVY